MRESIIDPIARALAMAALSDSSDGPEIQEVFPITLELGSIPDLQGPDSSVLDIKGSVGGSLSYMGAPLYPGSPQLPFPEMSLAELLSTVRVVSVKRYGSFPTGKRWYFATVASVMIQFSGDSFTGEYSECRLSMLDNIGTPRQLIMSLPSDHSGSVTVRTPA